jgi:hypothetical protein
MTSYNARPATSRHIATESYKGKGALKAAQASAELHRANGETVDVFTNRGNGVYEVQVRRFTPRP